MLDEPMPIPGAQDVEPVAREMISTALDEQVAKGLKRYGTPLQTFNGRDSFHDLAQELADATMYMAQSKLQYEAMLQKLREAYELLAWFKAHLFEVTVFPDIYHQFKARLHACLNGLEPWKALLTEPEPQEEEA